MYECNKQRNSTAAWEKEYTKGKPRFNGTEAGLILFNITRYNIILT